MTDKIYVQIGEDVREASSQELEQFKLDQAAQQVLEAELEAKATARTSALAKLAALGLTEEEIAAL